MTLSMEHQIPRWYLEDMALHKGIMMGYWPMRGLMVTLQPKERSGGSVHRAITTIDRNTRFVKFVKRKGPNL